jgi:queuine tRNA-ribosyltransferase
MAKNHFEPHRLEDGSYTIRDLRTDELMHSEVGLLAEAEGVFIGPSNLRERLDQAGEPLIVYDIGMGIAANAVASFRAAETVKKKRALEIYSFESDLDGIRLALDRFKEGEFSHFSGYEKAIETLLEKGVCIEESFTWKLKEGDFRENLSCVPAPDLIFFDLYCPQKHPDLWNCASFRLLFEKSTRPSQLFTYAAATSVRVALMLAGFSVGYGGSTSMKRETTVAATDPTLIKRPLDLRWLSRFQNSHKKWPNDAALPENAAQRIEARVLSTCQ